MRTTTRRYPGVAPGEALLSRCRAHDLTPSAVLLACYADTIARWSRRPRFLLNVPTFDRGGGLPTENVIGDFTTVELLEVDLSRPGSVAEQARASTVSCSRIWRTSSSVVPRCWPN